MKKLFSFWLIFQLFILPVYADEVILGGDSIGIQIHFDGVLITGTYEVNVNGQSYNPNKADILTGDMITHVNQEPIQNIAQLNDQLLQHLNESVELTLVRQNETIVRSLEVKNLNGQIRSGLFVKDEILGIGTLTFIHPETKTFASLGHEVLASETNQLAPIGTGTLFKSEVVGIRKAAIHQVGEKQARINFSNTIGAITKNNTFGIYGFIERFNQEEMISTADAKDVVLGQAIMYTVLENDVIEPVQIEITHVNPQASKNTKGFEFKIIDEGCLEKTNGIIQGMSGSPIVQNNKLVGAVTHVSGSNPQSGYGIYIEWMLEESKSDLIRQ